MRSLRYLNKYLWKYKWSFLAGTIIVITGNLFYALPAQVVRFAVDLVTEGASVFGYFANTPLEGIVREDYITLILFHALLILIFAILRGIFLYAQRKVLIGMSRHIEYDLKNEIYQHYQILPLSFYRRNNTGDLVSRISEDVSQVRMYLGPAIMHGINLLTLFGIVIPLMLMTDVKLTLYTLIPLPILSVSIYFVNQMINKRSTEIQRGLSELSTSVQEAFSGIRVLKAFTREKNSSDQFHNLSNQYRSKYLKLIRVNAFFFPLILALTGFSTILVVFVGGQQVITGEITYGVIAEFIIYINMLTWPVASLGWTTSLIQRAEASQTRINEFLQTSTDIVSGDLKKEVDGKIEFRNVSYTYKDTGLKALDKVSFEVNPGESIAILGSTGSGKSTLANLITRLFNASEGDIFIDDYNIRDYDLQAYRSQTGYVPQDVFLFSDTIRNNIAFGKENLSEEKIRKAAKDADLYDNIMDFPKQFDTVLGERGITLSGGQKQRLSISRAIVRNPKILVLDDALSAVDTKTENQILNSLKKIMKGRTSVIISHRVSSAKLADKIIILEDGKVVERGSHEELISRPGPYKTLYHKQAVAEEER